MQPFPTFVAISTLLIAPYSKPSLELLKTPYPRKSDAANVFLVRDNTFGRMAPTDVFQPVATGPPPHQLPSRGGHPVPRLGIVSNAILVSLIFKLIKDEGGSTKLSPVYQ